MRSELSAATALEEDREATRENLEKMIDNFLG
jgi:hypothetical protein